MILPGTLKLVSDILPSVTIVIDNESFKLKY
jgi:hypothetical protein